MTTIANKYYHTLQGYGIDKALAEGQAWYPEAWAYCRDISREFSITPERVAAIIAVTSPRARWSKNMTATYNIVEDSFKPKHLRRSSYGILGANAAKGLIVANDRYYSRHVTGKKVSNFYLNLVGHTEPVTVDSIMSKAAGYGSDVNDRIRGEVTEAVRCVAQMFAVANRDAQAAVWIAYRGGAY